MSVAGVSVASAGLAHMSKKVKAVGMFVTFCKGECCYADFLVFVSVVDVVLWMCVCVCEC